MNKVYKVIWNAATGSWTAVSELGKSKTKTKSVTLAVAGALAIASGAANAENIVQGTGAQALAGDSSVVFGTNAVAQQGDSVVIGQDAATTQNHAIAIGTGAKAISYGDIAIGRNAMAEHAVPDEKITDRQSAIAIGTNANANKLNTIAIGNYANASAAGTSVYGNNATADSIGSTALGERAKATGGEGATAAGRDATASAQAATAVGNHATASGLDSSAYGDGSTASGQASTATGRLSEATGVSSTATGQAAKATEQNTVATGSAAEATGYGASATGFDSTASGYLSTATGSSSVASGTQSTASGAASQATADQSSAYGTASQATGQSSTALGQNAKATDQNASAVGTGASATGTFSTALGTNSQATGWGSTATGVGAEAAGISSAAYGRDSLAAYRATALGSASEAAGSASTAAGYGSKALAAGTVALGENSQATARDAIALGHNALASDPNSVVIGANSQSVGYTQAPNTKVTSVDGSESYEYDAAKYAGNTGLGNGNYVSIGAAGAERQLKNVAAATISADSTDGVNGSQLYAVMERLEFVSKAGFNVGENNTAGTVNVDGNSANATNVGLHNNINFNNGHLTVARVEAKQGQDQNDANVYYDVVTQALATTSTDGKAAVGTDAAQSNGAPVNTGTADAPVTAPNPNALTTAQNVADAINASGWKVQGNNEDKDIVNPGDTVNFVNGSATTAVVTSENGVTTVKYDLNVDEVTTKITNGSFAVKTVPLATEGTAAAGDQKTTVAEADKNAIATAGDVVNAVNSARESVSTGNADTVKVETSANGVGGTDYKVTVVTSPITQSGTAAAGDQKSETAAPNAIATAGDVVNAVNSARETVVSTDKTVTITTKENAAGGTEYDLSVKTNSDTVKFTDAGVLEVATATIAPADAATGVVAAPDTANGTIATAADVVNAINSAGWLVENTDGTTSVVNAGDKVVYANGTGTTATVETVDGTTTVKYSVNTDGSKTTKFDPTTNTVEVATGSIATDPTTGKVNPADTTNGTIATVGDVVNAINDSGFSLKGNGTEATIINPGDSLNFVNGTGTVAEVKANGDVTFNLNADGTTIAVDPTTGKVEAVTSPIVQAGPVVAGNQASVATNPDALVTAGEVANAVNSARETVTSNNNTVIVTPSKNTLGGTNYDLAVRVDGNTVQINNKGELVANAVINLQDGINTKVTQVQTTDGTRVYQIDANKDLVDINSIQINGPKGADGTNGKDGATLNVGKGPAGVDGLGTDGQPGTEKTRIVYQPLDANGNPVVDANGNPVVENVATLNDGLKFTGENGQPVVIKKLNETLAITGGASTAAGNLTNGNIGVVANPTTGALEVKLAKDVDLGSNGSVKAGTVTVASNNGPAIGLTSATGPSFNTAGQADGGTVNVLNVGTAANPTRLAGVANGEISATSRDAINGSQLKGVIDQVNDVEENANAGTAGALATAGLPQAYLPGKNLIAVAAGTYQSQVGYAVGFSSISDGGNWIFKGTATANSQGNAGGTIGLGYQW